MGTRKLFRTFRNVLLLAVFLAGILPAPVVQAAVVDQVLGDVLDPVNGSLRLTHPSGLKVTYNIEMLHDGTTNAADNKSNYRLVTAESLVNLVTDDCSSALGTGETTIAVTSVSYDEATDEVTLPVNGGVGLPNGYYRLLMCGNLKNTTNADFNSGDPAWMTSRSMNHPWLPSLPRQTGQNFRVVSRRSPSRLMRAWILQAALTEPNAWIITCW